MTFRAYRDCAVCERPIALSDYRVLLDSDTGCGPLRVCRDCDRREEPPPLKDQSTSPYR